MTALTMPARPDAATPACGRCRGGGWPGSPGGSTGSRWPAWPYCWARWRCTCGSSACSCTTPTPPRPPATRRARRPAATWSALLRQHTQRPANDRRRSCCRLVPALIGAFAGAPVLARELETGTFRYAWTQGFGRWRWTLAKLVLLAVVVAAAAGAFSVLFSWYYQPYFAAGYGDPGLARSTCSTCAGSRSPPGRWPPSRSAPWPACSSAGSSPRSPPPWPSTPGSPSRPRCSCASTT